ncbi:winged helix-turn-helix transcriptional regulator [Hydrogenophaga sp.]|uniref:winged helix-turn-helix transcriptional regulator n=1 Tax=Hydrogenophaga sp. TaxID=1904254 RepID=UPI0035649916
MGAQAHAATIQLFDLLESRYALRVIWALADGHPQTFRLLQDSVGGATPNTLNTRLKELRAAWLVEHGGSGYQLTPQGADLARRLGEVPSFAGKWVHSSVREAHTTPRRG